MIGQIELSENTRQLLERLDLLNGQEVPEKVSLEDCLGYLNTGRLPADQAATQFLRQSFNLALMSDLLAEIQNAKNEPHSGASWLNYAKFFALTLAGIVFFGCEGYDSIATFMGIFNLPGLLVMSLALGFSLLSITVFFGFELVEISNNLNVELKSMPWALDTYYNQLVTIRALRKVVAEKIPADENHQIRMEQYLIIIRMLKKRFDELDEARDKYRHAHQNLVLRLAKIIASVLAGILYFGGGFFAGQSVAIVVIGLILGSAVHPGFWPVIALSIVVGLAAFSIYWFVQRPGLQSLMARWVGLDEQKIDALCSARQKQEDLTALNGLEHYAETAMREKIDDCRQSRLRFWDQGARQRREIYIGPEADATDNEDSIFALSTLAQLKAF